MKYLVVLLVIVLAWWWLAGRVRGASKGVSPRKAQKTAASALMIECAHCRLNLPDAEAVHDAAGRAFCSEAHRLAGPK